jgi:tripartite-type tricarboxylate transporter receptor subunit TctC
MTGGKMQLISTNGRCRRRMVLASFGALTLGCSIQASAAGADNYPVRPIRVLVPFAPGGGADLTARLVAPHLSQRLGQTVVIDNRPAAAGILATELAARSVPDGYTLFLPTSTYVANALLYKVSYDTINDFSPITLAVSSPLVLVIHPSMPVQNLEQFIAYTRADPDRVNFGSSGAGSATHLAGELLKSMAKIQMTHIVYKGAAPAVTAVIGNQIQLAIPNILMAQPHVRAGRLRALGVTSARRSAAAPDWPTIAEAGLPGYQASIWFGFMAPAKTPGPVIEKLHREIAAILQLPDIKQRVASQGGEALAANPEEFAQTIRADYERIRKLIKSTGLRAE